jgi:hypothetical protein
VQENTPGQRGEKIYEYKSRANVEFSDNMKEAIGT